MLAKSRLVVQCLRVFWIVITLWCELLVFYSSVNHCSWPDSALLSPTHILLVADPQILDHNSYPDRPPILAYLTQLIVDLNIRKSWRAALRTHPDAIIFLGDMMDGGRSTVTDADYERYYRRFQNIFSTPSQIPAYFIPGNHDIGLQISTSMSGPARRRYKSHFGDLNSRLSIANHTMVLLDAPSLVEEDYKRANSGQSYNEWQALAGGSVEFIKVVADEHIKGPVILFSHIPLYRNTDNCGPLREKGTIQPGGGFGYQNTLGKDVTSFLLRTLRPSVAFSGDDHDYCVYYHPTATHGGTHPIREVSVKSISMSMGIRRPGFQLLSLDSWGKLSDRPQQADVLCLLPDQLGIYLFVYVPLLLVSILVVFVANSRHMRGLKLLPFTHQHIRRMPSPSHTAKPSVVGTQRQVEGLESANDGTENTSSVLPYHVPALSGSRRYSDLLRQIGMRICKLFPNNVSSQQGSRKPMRKSFLGGSLLDIWDIAVYPLGVFVVICFYVTLT